MKRLIILIALLIVGIKLHAQPKSYRYRDLEYSRDMGGGEKKWVVLYNLDTTAFYSFGYTFIDPDEGFVFQKVGSFKIDGKGRYIPNKADFKETFERKYHMRQTSWQNVNNYTQWVALLPVKHYKELGITVSDMDSIQRYYVYTDTLAYNYKRACVFMETLYIGSALHCLEGIYKTDPHYAGVNHRTDKLWPFFPYKGVELLLAHAYSRLQQFDKGIAVMKNAIGFNPKNTSFYKELGTLYSNKKEWNNAIDAYKRGITLIQDEKSYQKYWFAGCISNMYNELKNDTEKVKWRALSDSYNPHPGVVF